MPDPSVTDLLRRWSKQDQAAAEQVFERLYGELHELASIQASRRASDAVVQTTMVLHEAYLKLSRLENVEWVDRDHFFAYSARTMRHVLVDLARQRSSQRRGSGSEPLALTLCADLPTDSASGRLDLADVVSIHEALEQLEGVDRERARIVELRFFAGLSPPEIGTVLNLSESTVHRRWRSARAWLYRRLRAKD